jgi:hypothetical protein
VTTTNIILAPAGPIRSVRDVLHDWSALGLIDPFLWVEPPGIGAYEVRALLIRAGNISGVDLIPTLSEFQSDAVQLCALVPAITGAAVLPTALEWQLAQLVGTVSNPILVRCTIARQGASPHHAVDPCVEGWHNIVLAPEDSEGPRGRRPLPLVETSDLAQIGRDAAGGLTGLLGLWSGMTERPLDRVRVTSGRNARLCRSFHRQLSGQTAELRLREAVLSTERGLPRPRQQSSALPYVEDVAQATAAAADGWWAAHQATLRGPRQKAAEQAPRPIGIAKTIRLFLTFMYAAVRNAPGAWLRRVKEEASVRVAQRVQIAVFGSANSAYLVVANGMTADGRPASWLDLANAADTMDDILNQLGARASSEGQADLSALWRDYAAGALTLADAAQRVTAVPPAKVGGLSAVVRKVADIVPDEAANYRSLKGHLAADVEEPEVRPFDALGVRNLNLQLEKRATNPGLRLEVDRARQDLRTWSETVRTSYSSRIGAHLGGEILRTSAEIKELLAWFRESSDEGGGPGERSQHGLARWMQVTVAVFVAVVGSLGAVLIAGLIGPLIFAVGGLVALVTAGVAALVRFYREQRELFRLLNRRQAAANAAAAATANLGQAVRDLRRQTDAYGRFLAWSDILGEFLARPFGRISAGDDAPLHLGGPLPNAIRFGTVEVDDESLAHVANELRRDVFGAGWMSDPWEKLVANARRRVGPDADDRLSTPDRIYAEPASNTVGEESILNRWAAILKADGPDTTSGDAVWAGLISSLFDARAPERSTLLQRIRSIGQNASSHHDLDSFREGVEAGLPAASSAPFRGCPLTPHGLLTLQSIAETVVSETREGLGFSATMTQFSDSIPSYEFALSASPRASASEQWTTPASPFPSEQRTAATEGASTGPGRPLHPGAPADLNFMEPSVPPNPFGDQTF